MKIAITLVVIALLSCERRSAQQSGSPQMTKRADVRAGTIDGKLPSNPTQPLNVGGEVTAPKVVFRVEPDIDACLKLKIRGSGNINIEAVIDEAGRLVDPRITGPVHPCIEQAALVAIKQWRFEPGTLRGKPVPVRLNLVVLIHWR